MNEDLDAVVKRIEELLTDEHDEHFHDLYRNIKLLIKKEEVCRGCIIRANMLLEKLETGLFSWERDYDKVQNQIDAVLNKIKDIKKDEE